MLHNRKYREWKAEQSPELTPRPLKDVKAMLRSHGLELVKGKGIFQIK